MIAVYIGCVVVSVLICFWYFMFDVRRSVVQNVMLLIMLAANLGYLSMATSTDLSGAILSTKIFYLGGCFLPVLFFLAVCEVSNINVTSRTKALLIAIQGIIYSLVCTIGYSDVYYKSVEFVSIDGIAHLNKVYGPFHIFYSLSVYIYFALSIAFAVYISIKSTTVLKKEFITIITSSICAFLVYIIERVVGMRFEIMPVAYIILLTGALVPMYRADIYAVLENQEVITEQLNSVGFISFDKKLRFMGATKTALELFEELEASVVGRRISNSSEVLGNIISDAEEFLTTNTDINSHQHNERKQYQIKDKTIEIKIHTLENFIGRRVGITMELRDISEHARVIELTQKYNEELSLEVRSKTKKIRKIQERTILGMAQMVESRDLSTGGHIKRTSHVVRIFSKKIIDAKIGLNKDFLKLVIRSAPMHDIGKIGVDDAILRKQGRFTDEEFEMMKRHAEIGGRMVKKILTKVEEPEFVEVAYNVARCHHEKVNGKGYPRGLKGDEIPIEARIMALADVFDALVSKRCYKDAFSYDEAFAIIEQDAGEHFDEQLAMIFLECRDELEEYYNEEKKQDESVI